MKYRLIRTDRRSVGINISPEGTITVRAPKALPKAEIDRILLSHKDWIEEQIARRRAEKARAEAIPRMTVPELRALAARAAEYLPERVRHYAPLIGVTYGRITIRSQRTRWGSCSAKGNLNFNCLLMLAPPDVIDSVVVHELCHRKEMNHSPRFYDEVLRVFPRYRECRRWLKDHGGDLMKRLPSK